MMSISDGDVWSVVASVAMAVCAAISTALAGVLLLRYLQARRSLSQFPGPTPRFLLGNLMMLIGEGGKAMPLFRLHHVLHKQYGSIVRFTMGSTPVLVISGTSTTRCLSCHVCPCLHVRASHVPVLVQPRGRRCAAAPIEARTA